MSTHFIAIDPGASGAVAFGRLTGEIDRVEPIDQSFARLRDVLKPTLTYGGRPIAVIEDVGYHVQGNNAQASATFARHCGAIEAFLFAYGYAIVKVHPQVWEPGILGITNVPRSKPERKRAIHAKVVLVYPHLAKLPIAQADAAGIFLYASRYLANHLKKAQESTP